MPHRMIIKNWEMCFPEKDGEENRLKVVDKFAMFLKDPSIKKMEVPGKCQLWGSVYSCDIYEDGTKMLSPNIRSIRRVGPDELDIISVIAYCEGKKEIYYGATEYDDENLIFAIAENGDHYYFYPEDCNNRMFVILGDYNRYGKFLQYPEAKRQAGFF